MSVERSEPSSDSRSPRSSNQPTSGGWRVKSGLASQAAEGAGADGGLFAALALGIGRNTITRKIAELGIDGGKESAAE